MYCTCLNGKPRTIVVLPEIGSRCADILVGKLRRWNPVTIEHAPTSFCDIGLINLRIADESSVFFDSRFKNFKREVSSTMVGMNEINRTYQLINSYGVIGDCHAVVLVSPDGSVNWGCLPDFDSPAIFCHLLAAERGGYFQIAPSEGGVPATQRYLPGSNVLKTHFTSIAGEIVLTDFMSAETLSTWPYKGINNNTWTREDGSGHLKESLSPPI